MPRLPLSLWTDLGPDPTNALLNRYQCNRCRDVVKVASGGTLAPLAVHETSNAHATSPELRRDTKIVREGDLMMERRRRPLAKSDTAPPEKSKREESA